MNRDRWNEYPGFGTLPMQNNTNNTNTNMGQQLSHGHGQMPMRILNQADDTTWQRWFAPAPREVRSFHPPTQHAPTELYDPYDPAIYTHSVGVPEYSAPVPVPVKYRSNRPTQDTRTFIAPVHRSSVYEVEGLNSAADEYVPEFPQPCHLPIQTSSYSRFNEQSSHHHVSNIAQHSGGVSNDGRFTTEFRPVMRDTEFQGYRRDPTYDNHAGRFVAPALDHSPHYGYTPVGVPRRDESNHFQAENVGAVGVCRQPDMDYDYGEPVESQYYVSRLNSFSNYEGSRCQSTSDPPIIRSAPQACGTRSVMRYYHAPREEPTDIQNQHWRKRSPEISIIEEVAPPNQIPRKRLWNSSNRIDYDETHTNAQYSKKAKSTTASEASHISNDKPPDKLYHYTNEDGAFGILKDKCIGMQEGTKRFGIGVYFTDLPPETCSGEIAFNNFRSRMEDKLLRTEYCFELKSKDIPSLEICREEERRPFWKAGVYQVHLERNTTYYRRELRGPDVPLSVEAFTTDF